MSHTPTHTRGFPTDGGFSFALKTTNFLFIRVRRALMSYALPARLDPGKFAGPGVLLVGAYSLENNIGAFAPSDGQSVATTVQDVASRQEVYLIDF